MYRIGTKVWQAGTLAYLNSKIRQVSGPFMQELYEHTHENVHLAAIEGSRAVYVDIVRGHSSTRTGVRVGYTAPLHATGEGKILLANAPKSLVNRVIEKSLPKFTPYTIVTPGHLLNELAKTRNRGIAFCNQELTLGTYSVAVSIRDACGTVFALSVVVNSSSPLKERLPALLTRTAAHLSSRLREETIHQPYGVALVPSDADRPADDRVRP
jgi:DNA-binding IclR family transcriptional regulator